MPNIKILIENNDVHNTKKIQNGNMKGKHYSPPPQNLMLFQGGDGGTGDPLFRKAIIISRVRVTAGPPEALEFRHQLGCMPDQFVPHLGRILWKYRQKGSRKKKTSETEI